MLEQLQILSTEICEFSSDEVGDGLEVPALPPMSPLKEEDLQRVSVVAQHLRERMDKVKKYVPLPF